MDIYLRITINKKPCKGRIININDALSNLIYNKGTFEIYYLSENNKIILDGGNLYIKWLEDKTVTLTGITEKVSGMLGIVSRTPGNVSSA